MMVPITIRWRRCCHRAVPRRNNRKNFHRFVEGENDGIASRRAAIGWQPFVGNGDQVEHPIFRISPFVRWRLTPALHRSLSKPTALGGARQAEAVELGPSRAMVHIVDDDPSFAAAIERRLRQAGYEVATYATAQALLHQLPTGDEPSCLLIDVRLPDLDGPALQRRLGELGSTMPIIFLTGFADTRIVVQTLKAGALDFLTKPVAPTICFTPSRTPSSSASIAHQQGTLDGIRARLATLTPRERQVFDLIIRGNTNKAVGRALDCTERTVKAHRLKVMEKMKVQTLADWSCWPSGSAPWRRPDRQLNNFTVPSCCCPIGQHVGNPT